MTWTRTTSRPITTAAFCCGKLGLRRRALDDAKRVITLAPDRAAGYWLLTCTLAGRDDLQLVRRLRDDFPGELPVAVTNLAWLLATHPDSERRNGAEAVEYAELALVVGPHETPTLVDVLAAAYAEAGRFAEAATTAREAIGLAAAAGQTELAEEIRGRLRLYQSGKPYRSPSVARPERAW